MQISSMQYILIQLSHLSAFSVICVSSTAVSCGVPETPANGSFHGFQYTVGSTVQFQCDDGYRPNEGSLLIAVCLEDGTWSNAAHPPRCLREQIKSSVSMPTAW